MPEVTAILLNWKRPENLHKVIKSIRSQSIDIDIWLWDNSNKNEPFDVDLRINSSKNLKCFPRWCLASMINTKYFFVIDDDLLINDKHVIKDCKYIFEKQNEPDLIIGNYGVVLNTEMNYFDSLHTNSCEVNINCDVIKGRFMFMQRSLLHNVNLQRDFTCEDIKVSSVSKNKLIPAMLKDRFTNLKEGNEALYKQEGQKDKRQKAIDKYFRV